MTGNVWKLFKTASVISVCGQSKNASALGLLHKAESAEAAEAAEAAEVRAHEHALQHEGTQHLVEGARSRTNGPERRSKMCEMYGNNI